MALETNPFGSLAIWREKLSGDVVGATGDEARLAMLLEQSKDVEEAVQGCLRDSLLELAECQAWGLLQPSFASTQRQHLYSTAAQELLRNKQHCVELAREHGVLEAYAAAIKTRLHHTVADYERVGDMRFALSCWKANLRRDCSLASDPLEIARLVEEGYYDALRLIRRCGSNSQRFWAAQQATDAPGAEAQALVEAAAVERAQKMLLEVPGPNAAPPEEGEEGGAGAGPAPSRPPVFKPNDRPLAPSARGAISPPQSVASMSDL
eukprot:scaffold2.g7216.t1